MADQNGTTPTFLLNRAPGKRRVKPTALNLDHANLQDDESDEDFVAKPDSDDEDDDDEGVEDEEGATSNEDEDGESPSGSVVVIEGSMKASLSPTDNNQEPLICSVCLNMRNISGDRVIQCDKCGVAVHESCYAVDDAESDQASVMSNFSTEPWFCEPCLFKLDRPPHCELCPSRNGAFKRADVGGKWLHLTCAMYTPGISFGDVENLAAVSWQEIDFKRFGRKACDGCSEPLEARTGIVTGCEAGLCKHSYHITCAQRLGLLVDAVAENLEDSDHSSRVVDPHFILCRTHNDSDVIAKKKRNYGVFMRQEQKRMVLLHRRLLNDREVYKRETQRKQYEERVKKFKGTTIHLPAVRHLQASLQIVAQRGSFKKHNKRPRSLMSSAEGIEAFTEKAELLDMPPDEFRRSFARVPGSQIPYIAPAFSEEYVRYVNHREHNVFNDEHKIRSDDQCELKKVQQAEGDLQLLLSKISGKSAVAENPRASKQKSAFEQRFSALCLRMGLTFEEDNALAEPTKNGAQTHQ